jgi:hypothetical protein
MNNFNKIFYGGMQCDMDRLCGLGGQGSWLQIQRPGFDSWRYQIFWEVAGLERGLPSLVSTIEEQLERKGSVSGLENCEYDRRDASRWQLGTFYPQKLALTSPTSRGCSVGTVRLRTQTMGFCFVCMPCDMRNRLPLLTAHFIFNYIYFHNKPILTLMRCIILNKTICICTTVFHISLLLCSRKWMAIGLDTKQGLHKWWDISVRVLIVNISSVLCYLIRNAVHPVLYK